jgi:isopenicillin N synthase-like dioxygenase
MTNGIYRSIEHRATINKEKERISIATFHSPKMNTIIGPAPSLIAKSSAMFNNMSCEDFFKGYFSRQLEGKSYIDVMRLQNK